MEHGVLEIPVDGRWSIEDLNDFAHSFRLSYVYFYVISEETTKDDDRARLLLARYFWSGDYKGDEFAEKLYFMVPDDARPLVQKFQYASLGVVEISAIIGVLSMLSLCVRSWSKTASAAFELYKEIDEYFYKRRLTRIPRNFDLDQLSPSDIDRARELCVEMGTNLGLNVDQIERVLNLTGNPISGLKLLAQIAHEAEKLARLERGGKAKIAQSRVRKTRALD
jgi:hypothetical protein